MTPDSTDCLSKHVFSTEMFDSQNVRQIVWKWRLILTNNITSKQEAAMLSYFARHVSCIPCTCVHIQCTYVFIYFSNTEKLYKIARML